MLLDDAAENDDAIEASDDDASEVFTDARADGALAIVLALAGASAAMGAVEPPVSPA